MTLISSHVLNSVIGDHAKGIRISCYRQVGGGRELLFDVVGDAQGRIAEEVVLNSSASTDSEQAEPQQLELVFHTAAYWNAQPNMPDARQIIDEAVVRFTVAPDETRIHIPLMLSPHSYSIWWSG